MQTRLLSSRLRFVRPQPRPRSPSSAHDPPFSLRQSAFTLIEIMVAIGIFSLVLAAIYSSWTAILRASRTGLEAAASTQRARVTIRVLEDSLASAQSFAANLRDYYFVGENGSEPMLSFVARLSQSFPRSGKFGDLDMRRVTFNLENAPDGGQQLVMRQNPIVMEIDEDEKKYPIVLAKNVKGFEMQFWDSSRTPPDWVDEWKEAKTNQLPKMIMITLRLADNPHSSQITEEITRIINIPSMTVAPAWQVPRNVVRPGMPGVPGLNPGVPGNPTVPGVPGQFPNPGFPGNPGAMPVRPQ
jgi:prepilin-type N-terminal cleavage/methylation domain-containing protein